MTAEDQIRDLLLPQFLVGEEVLKARRAPTTDGYYWFKGKIERDEKTTPWLIVYRDTSFTTGLFLLMGTENTYDLVDLDGLFIGPLEAPHQ